MPFVDQSYHKNNSSYHHHLLGLVCGTSTSQILLITDGRVFYPPTKGAVLKQRPVYTETRSSLLQNLPS